MWCMALVSGSRPTIALDQDGNLFDWSTRFNSILLNLEPNFPVVPEGLRTHFDYFWVDGADRNTILAALNHPRLYDDLEPLPGAIEAAREMLSMGMDTFVVSTPTWTNQGCVQGKLKDLAKQLGEGWDKRLATYLQRMARGAIEKQRQAEAEDAREAEQDAQRPDPRIELEYLLYINGDIDEHSSVHGVPSLMTILAGELYFKHRGWTFSGITYQNANKTARPSATERQFTVATIHHLVKDAILINGGHLYLRPDTVLRVVSRS